MKILRDEDIPIDLWIDLVNNCLYSTPFQTPEYWALFNSLPGNTSSVFAVSENSQLLALSVVNILKENGVKGYFSKRAVIYGGPLIRSGNASALDQLLFSIIDDTKNKAIYLESRNLYDYNHYIEVFKSHRFSLNPHLNFTVNTENSENMWNKISSSRRRQIKQGLKSGAIIREAIDSNDIKAFYQLLAELYKTKVKKPLLPELFFLNFFKMNLGKIFLVEFEDKIIGGILCPVLQNKAIYELYICGLDKVYKKQYPSILATYAAIDFACKNGISLFDFMGAGKPGANYGVYEFKSRFGGQEHSFGRFLHVNQPILYQIGKLGINIASRIK